MSDIVKKIIEKSWENSGLLEGLEEEEKVICSVLLEKAADLLLLKQINLYWNPKKPNITILLFPIIRRIFGQLLTKEKSAEEASELIDIEKIIYEVNIECKNFAPNLDDPYTDHEAKMCVDYCMEYIKMDTKEKYTKEKYTELEVIELIDSKDSRVKHIYADSYDSCFTISFTDDTQQEISYSTYFESLCVLKNIQFAH